MIMIWELAICLSARKIALKIKCANKTTQALVETETYSLNSSARLTEDDLHKELGVVAHT